MKYAIVPLVFLALVPSRPAGAAPASAPAGQAVEQELLPAGKTPRTRASRGNWQLEPQSVSAPVETKAFWIVAGRGANLADGQLRARADGGSLNLGLLLRARLDESGRQLQEGIVLHLRGREAWLALQHQGAAHRLGPAVKLRRWPEQGLVEITALLLGARIWINILEAANGAQLATLASDRAPDGDGVGLVGVPASRRGTTVLTRLAVRTACVSEVKRAPATGKGPFIVALLPEAQSKLVQVTDDVRRLDRHAGDPPRVGYRVNAAGLEKLFCAGRRLLALQTDFPWKYLDLGYGEQKKLPPQRTASGFRIDLSSKNPDMVEALLRGWQARYRQHSRLVTLGKSHQGRPLIALVVGSTSASRQRPAVLLDGAHHGDEPFSVELVLDAIQTLLERSSEPRVRRWLNELVIWCVPVVNPDGLAAFLEVVHTTGRKNGRGLSGAQPQSTDAGVDLNRNYPFHWSAVPDRRLDGRPEQRHSPGPAAGSEPETQAMMALARREHFVAAISFHTGTVAVLAPYTIDGVKNPVPNEAWLVADEVARQLPAHPQGKPFRVRRKIYSVEGTDQDWHRHEHGTLAFILESARHSPLGAVERNQLVAAVRPFWELLLDRFLDGPSLSGRVLDSEGRPVEAEVRLREIRLNDGEHWTARARDGRFDRFLPRAGRYHVEVLRCGSIVLTKAVQVGKQRARLELQLPEGAASTCDLLASPPSQVNPVLKRARPR